MSELSFYERSVRWLNKLEFNVWYKLPNIDGRDKLIKLIQSKHNYKIDTDITKVMKLPELEVITEMGNYGDTYITTKHNGKTIRVEKIIK